MTTFDFSGLTPAQQELLTFKGWQPGSRFPARQPRPQTVRKLIERGLVVERPVQFMGITIKAYDVPLATHMAWCEHCSKQPGASA